ncbi:MAG: ParB/RepB/Spo0J family partition protein [Acidobacteriota bacterium]
MTQRRALGRGLGSLIPEAGAAAPAPAETAPVAPPAPYHEVDLDRIDPNPAQPRHRFSDPELEELASSIREHGVVQPVLVRRRGDRYQIIAGERRLRAAQRAGLRRVPAVIREVPDDRMLEVALVENIQRQELDPIDEALAYRSLLGEAGLTQQQIASRLGKSGSTVSNSLRLLGLSDSVQELLRSRALSPGHARALLALPEAGGLRESTAKRIVDRGLSVREVERLAARRKTARPEPAPSDPNTRDAEERLMRSLGTRVRIRRQGEGGRVEISFHDEEELDRIFEYIVGTD